MKYKVIHFGLVGLMTPEISILSFAIAMLQFQVSQNQAPDRLIYEAFINSQHSSYL